ncbi:MAG TPA: hypothetical protein PKI45_04875 [Candidatus Omnitrophota bacterium]|nr:hypothetical protein [Candidatus Omnitrophota bacterium]
MRSILKKFFLAAALLLVAVVFLANLLLGRIAKSEEFRKFAEQRIGQYLKAKVNIGQIRPHGFNQIALEKIIIETPSAKSASQMIRLESLIFRYDLSQLWTRRFDVPAGVVLKNPTILIEPDQFPYRYFEGGPQTPPGLSMPALDFSGGEIRYLLPKIGKEILLSGLDGKIFPSPDRTVQIDVRAKAAGFLEGKVRIYGQVRPFEHTHDLWLELGAVNFSKDLPIPLREIEGRVRWVGQDLFFEELKTVLYGWQTELSGAFQHQAGLPEMACHLRAGKENLGFKLDFLLNLALEKLEGSFQPMGDRVFPFNGKVRQDGKRFIADSLWVDRDWAGKAELDLTSGNYQLAFEQGRKRFAVHSNLLGMDFAVYFHFDHLKIFSMDIVTQGKMFLHSTSRRWRDRNFMFKGNFETDYFILQKQPFEDLNGAFDVSAFGITGIRSSWGKQFQMTGQMTFPGKKPQGKFLVRVSNFDLGLVQEFASRPLPKALGGFVDGKLVVEGELEKPEVIGTFNIRDGKWGRLSYDRGIIQIRGFPPYLPLKDSKVWKGRTIFYLNGALDLKLDNIFAGVKIETPDHLVIWKGLEAALHEKDRTLEVNRSAIGGWGEFSALEAKADEKAAVVAPDASQDGREDEKTVTVGPRLKF